MDDDIDDKAQPYTLTVGGFTSNDSNYSSLSSREFTLINLDDGKDKNLPTDLNKPIGAIIINQGKKHTSSPRVYLNISGMDDIGITGYFISESNTTPDINHSGWVTVTPKPRLVLGDLKYTLSNGDGEKVLNVWLKDFSGKISDKKSASIFLDTQAPSINIVSPNSNETLFEPIHFIVQYQGADFINLKPEDVLLEVTDNLIINKISVTGDGKDNRTISLTEIMGKGQVSIKIKSRTASDFGGYSAPASKKSPLVHVQETFFPIGNTPGLIYDILDNSTSEKEILGNSL